MIKKCINNILFRLIEFIENKQYKNLKKDQSDPFKKIININFVDKEDLYVDSPNGWVKVEEINETQPYTIWYLRTNKGKELFCADNHMLYDDNGDIVFVQDLKQTDWIHTKDGFEYIDEIYSYRSNNCMVDLSVDSLDMNYYTNDILSHNTITAAITILHYALFNKDRGIMIVANKGDTVIEIIDKIKNIYKQLPFFLKNGIVNWNQKNIVFENGCRIKSSARSKEPAIGFTIDFLYMDEFAHIPPSIINHYYKAAIPTVSSMSDSKIVITSTPNGANLFKDLVVGSLLPKGHPDKNIYNLVKVYWYQVPDGKFEDGTNGTRMDPKLFFEKKQLDRLGIKLDDIFKFLDDKGFKHAVRSEKSGTGDKQFIKVLYEKDKCNIDIIRRLKYNDIQFTNIFSITNWHENEIKLIGGEEAFNQEYNIQFIAGSKRVLSAMKAQELNDRDVKYKYRKIDLLEDRLKFPYDELIWHPDFNLEDRFNHYWLTVIDTSEGLGADDSVMNLFRLCVRDDEWLQQNKIRNMYEAFYFKQTAVYNYNRISPDIELPELYYLLHFEFLNPNKCKTVLELNGPGSMFLSQIPNVFNQTNNFGNHIFVRYKHRKTDNRRKPGMKMTRDKKLLVKSYIDTLEVDRLYVDESQTLAQVENFIKVETPGGNYTYKADAGKDDITMTLVCGSTFFNTQDFKNMCNSLYKELPKHVQELIDKSLDINYNSDVISYGSVKKALSKTRGSFKRSGKYTGGGGNGRFMR